MMHRYRGIHSMLVCICSLRAGKARYKNDGDEGQFFPDIIDSLQDLGL